MAQSGPWLEGRWFDLEGRWFDLVPLSVRVSTSAAIPIAASRHADEDPPKNNVNPPPLFPEESSNSAHLNLLQNHLLSPF